MTYYEFTNPNMNKKGKENAFLRIKSITHLLIPN